jgi:AraC-like DNA-binding protein
MVALLDDSGLDVLQAKADLAAIRHTIHQHRQERLTPDLICCALAIPRTHAESILAHLAGTCLQEEIWAIKAVVLYTAIADDPGADLEDLLQQVGFDSIFSASSIFRHCYGMTPMRFRVQCQQAWAACLVA